jgi:HSP20 family protein
MENQNHNTQLAQPAQQQPAAQQNQTQRRYVRPRASITENGNGFVVTVEMPGVNRNGLEVTFENGELTLVGHRTPFRTDAELVYRESRPMDFRRTFELDASIDAGNIGAQLDQGLLTLSLPKSAAAQPRRIEVAGLN